MLDDPVSRRPKNIRMAYGSGSPTLVFKYGTRTGSEQMRYIIQLNFYTLPLFLRDLSAVQYCTQEYRYLLRYLTTHTCRTAEIRPAGDRTKNVDLVITDCMIAFNHTMTVPITINRNILQVRT